MWRIAAVAVVLVSCATDTVPGDRPDPDIVGGLAIVLGRALDSNGTGVPTALVLIQSDPVEVSTDASGAFSGTVPAGDHHLSVTKHGETFIELDFSIEAGDTLDLGDILPGNPFIYSRMSVREASMLRERFHGENTWSTLSIEDELGTAIGGLTISDFTVTDAIRERASGTIVATDVIDLPAQNAEDWYDAGVWEHNRTRTKLDIVFMVDATGSLGDEIDDIKAQIHAFAERLRTANMDFRMAGVRFESGPNIHSGELFRFHSDWQIDLLHEEIDATFIAAGEGWNPTVAYDALMMTEWLQYRDDARRVAVILSDIVPYTVYGTHWYAPSSSVSTVSGAELFIAENGIEVFFAKDPAAHIGIDAYVLNDINPRANDAGSGLIGLAERGFATQLGWPFSQAELAGLLNVDADRPLMDSQYLVMWRSTFGWDPPWYSAPEDYERLLTVELDDPVRPGEVLSTSFTLPILQSLTDVAINVAAEDGNDPNEMRADLFRLCGGRPGAFSGQLLPVDGVISLSLPQGRYHFEIYDGGRHSFNDTSLRALARTNFEVGAEPLSVDIVVPVSDTAGELARCRGLLRDLDDWRISGDPFRDFVIDAETWLVEIEENGISWQEMTQLRRFNTALAGYANLTEYAQLETESAVEDFVDIVADFRDVVKQVKKLGQTTSDKWYTELASIVLDVIYAVLTRGEFNAKKEALEVALDRLLEYAGTELLDELKEHVVEQFPADAEVLGPLTRLTFALLGADFNSEDGPDLGPVIDAAQELLLDAALITVRETIGEDVIDDIMDEIDVETQWEDDIKGLLRDILNALVRRNHDMSHFRHAVEAFARRVGQTLLVEDRDATIASINRMFDQVQGRLDAYPDVRDFLVGFARDLTIASLPRVKGRRVIYEVNTDAIVEILIRHGLYNVVLRHYYVDEVNRGLTAALDNAKTFTLPPGDRGDWESDMSQDFWDYRQVVDDAQVTAWNALRVQDAVENWATGLQSLVTLLNAVSVPLDFVAALYPPLQDTADELHIFIAVLDGIDIISQAIEFGLKLDCLSRFGSIGEDLYIQAYPH